MKDFLYGGIVCALNNSYLGAIGIGTRFYYVNHAAIIVKDWWLGISLFCFYFIYFLSGNSFLTYYAQYFAQSFNALLKVKLYN